MVYEEKRQLFLEQIVQPAINERLLQFEALFQHQSNLLSEQFLTFFDDLCQRMCEAQADGKKGAIAYITFSMLRTEIATSQANYLVEVTDENWYLDREPICFQYNANWAFQPFYDLESNLVNSARKYVGVNAIPEVEKIKRDYASKFHAYVVELIRRTMCKAILLESYKMLQKHVELEVRVGEYLDKSEIVWKEDYRKKNNETIKAWLEQKNDTGYTYEMYNHLNLSDGDYQGINVSYSNFEHSNLSNSLWNGSLLFGTNLANCYLEKSQFCATLLCEADFSGSNLREALFCASIAKSGMPNDDEWERPGFAPIRFNGADLTGADFAYSNMRGAEFIGAILDHVVFKETDLTGAKFLKADFSKLTLTDKQRTSIQWVEKEGVNIESISSFTR